MRFESENRAKDIKHDFSLEKRIYQIPLPSAKSSPVRAWSRFFLWILPAPGVALIAIVATIIHETGWLSLPVTLITILCIFFSILLVGFIGYCDSFLSLSVSKQNGKPVTAQAITHSLLFFLAQLSIGPIVFSITVFLAIVLFK